MNSQDRLFLSIAPLVVISSYLLLTLFCFFFGPIDWPLFNPIVLIVFLAAVFLCIACGYLLGIAGGCSSSDNRWSVFLFTAGCVFALILFFPSLYVYTHKMPWDILGAISKQGEVYKDMLVILSEDSAGRKVVAVLRMIIAPLTITIIPFAILSWPRLGWGRIMLFIAFLLSQLVFSLMRGTDKEIADLMIMTGGTGLICVARHYIRGKRFPSVKKVAIGTVVGVCILVAGFSLFSERKMARAGGAKEFCLLSKQDMCVSYDGPILSELSEQTKFGLAMLSTYISHGYYGLYLALNQPFEPMFGFGHSYILTSLYAKISGDVDFYKKSYLSKSKDQDWDEMGVWSSLFPWIANDISFIGVPFFIGLLAFMMAKAWRSAVYGFDNTAALIFTMLLLLFIYVPANNQLTQTADMYCSFWFWVVVWIAKSLSVNGRLYVCK